MNGTFFGPKTKQQAIDTAVNIQNQASNLIDMIPTSDARNDACDINILLLQLIQKLQTIAYKGD
jgi:hypothetical protein